MPGLERGGAVRGGRQMGWPSLEVRTDAGKRWRRDRTSQTLKYADKYDQVGQSTAVIDGMGLVNSLYRTLPDTALIRIASLSKIHWVNGMVCIGLTLHIALRR